MNKVLFSSQNNDWSTPQAFFDKLNEEFHFTLDACALPENAKCKLYFTPEMDGLSRSWSDHTAFVNPPYGKQIAAWVEKCYHESCKENTKVVLLIPARTDTVYFHRFIYKKAEEIRFIKGRLKFGNAKNSAPFPSMVVIY
ncbi:MAG: phage N-6-adenine-methyltransferase [Candidatus Azobacteroides sp.]|nr:phage N-6-adenine-methyltransferase [Candidatus Azobacteroides sp.]